MSYGLLIILYSGHDLNNRFLVRYSGHGLNSRLFANQTNLDHLNIGLFRSPLYLNVWKSNSYCNFNNPFYYQVNKLQEVREKSAGSMVSAYNREMDTYARSNDLNFSIKSRMMDMRKSTNHPYLLEYPLTECGTFYRIDQDLVEICGKMKVLDQMLTALLERKHKVLIFSQMTRMLDIIQDFCNLRVGIDCRTKYPILVDIVDLNRELVWYSNHLNTKHLNIVFI